MVWSAAVYISIFGQEPLLQSNLLFFLVFDCWLLFCVWLEKPFHIGLSNSTNCPFQGPEAPDPSKAWSPAFQFWHFLSQDETKYYELRLHHMHVCRKHRTHIYVYIYSDSPHWMLQDVGNCQQIFVPKFTVEIFFSIRERCPYCYCPTSLLLSSIA